MKKVRTLLMATVMVVGLSAISATTANAGCADFSIDCGSGIVASGGVCGDTAQDMIDQVMDMADFFCG